jgi:hypothetical protein
MKKTLENLIGPSILNAPENLLRLACESVCKKSARRGWMFWIAGGMALAAILFIARRLLRRSHACRCVGRCTCGRAAHESADHES